MSSCEKCWRDSRGDTEEYSRLIKINNCTPEEQAGGKYAGTCKKCGNKTVHMYTKRCVSQECNAK